MTQKLADNGARFKSIIIARPYVQGQSACSAQLTPTNISSQGQTKYWHKPQWKMRGSTEWCMRTYWQDGRSYVAICKGSSAANYQAEDVLALVHSNATQQGLTASEALSSKYSACASLAC